ncbi:hypothetical protein PanWU01x14_160980, partial [Parasponia andersonii]
YGNLVHLACEEQTNFENKSISHHTSSSFVLASLQEIIYFNTKGMNNSQHDLVILCRPSLPYRPKKTPRIISVHWFPPLLGWVKVNVDGSAQGKPGVISLGGVFRKSRGFVLGCFASKIGIGFLSRLNC